MKAGRYSAADAALWFDLFDEHTAGYFIALAEIRAERGEPAAIEKMATFRNAKALRRMTR